MRLVLHQAGDHVNAAALELLRPVDVQRFVEPRLHFDEDRYVLACSGSVQQRVGDLRGPARSIQCELDGGHVRIIRGLHDEALRRLLERVVRMMHEYVALVEHVEHRPVGFDRLGLLERLVVQLGQRELRELGHCSQVDQPVCIEDVRWVDGNTLAALLAPQLPQQQVADRVRHGAFHFDPHHRSLGPLQDVVLYHFEEVVRSGLAELHLGAPSQPERVDLQHLARGIECPDVFRDQVL